MRLIEFRVYMLFVLIKVNSERKKAVSNRNYCLFSVLLVGGLRESSI